MGEMTHHIVIFTFISHVAMKFELVETEKPVANISYLNAIQQFQKSLLETLSTECNIPFLLEQYRSQDIHDEQEQSQEPSMRPLSSIEQLYGCRFVTRVKCICQNEPHNRESKKNFVDLIYPKVKKNLWKNFDFTKNILCIKEKRESEQAGSFQYNPTK
jgi:hypothetical protein